MLLEAALASRLDVRFVPREDEGDLQPAAERLVEQEAGLEGGHEREPREHRHWDEDKYAHSRVIQTSDLAQRVPQAQPFHHASPCDCYLLRLYENES